MKALAICLVLCAVLLAGGTLGHSQAVRKKVISAGWDMPTAQQLRRDIDVLDQGPFDGVIVEIKGEGVPSSVNGCPLRETFSATAWDRAWFESAVADLRALRPKRLTDNFASVRANPGGVDWFDDAGWSKIVDHVRSAAWVAKQGDLKGILFDPERYTKPFSQYSQFMYASQPQRDQHSFAEYCAQARVRGRQVMEAMVAEYPDITVLTFFLNSTVIGAAGSPDPMGPLSVHPYGLLPAFLDGWLDAALPEVTIVDGNESAYTYNSELQFAWAAAQMRADAQALVSPENREKYRRQVQPSFGVYLDGYVVGPESSYYMDGKGVSRVARLQTNLLSAARAADEYVWMWGERGRWWPEPGGTAAWANKSVYAPWEEVLPGSDFAVRAITQPFTAATRRIAALQQAGAPNLARNGDFRSEAAPVVTTGEAARYDGGPPAGWLSWQEDDSHGIFTWDRTVGASTPGSARVSGASGGCLIQHYPVKPGERFVISLMVRVQGGSPDVVIGWKTPEGKWMPHELDQRLMPDPRSDWRHAMVQGEWFSLAGCIIVPEGAGGMALLPSAAGQRTAADAIWYDDVRVFQVP